MSVIETFVSAIEKFTADRSQLANQRDALQARIDGLDRSIKAHFEAVGRVHCESLAATAS
jgi:hypothetical protein